jgi:hypothetical protein
VYARLRTGIGVARAPYGTSSEPVRAGRSAATAIYWRRRATAGRVRASAGARRTPSGNLASVTASPLKCHVCAPQVLLTCTDEMGRVDRQDGSRAPDRWVARSDKMPHVRSDDASTAPDSLLHRCGKFPAPARRDRSRAPDRSLAPDHQIARVPGVNALCPLTR